MPELLPATDSKTILKETEKRVIARMREIESNLKNKFDLNLNFFPNHQGMKLATRVVGDNFPLGSTLIKALRTASLSTEQITQISSKIGNKYNLFDADLQSLENKLQAVGVLLTRLKLDSETQGQKIYKDKAKIKLALMNNLLSGFEIVLEELKKAKSGEVRKIEAKDYFRNTLTKVLNNMKQMVSYIPNEGQELFQKSIDRYETIQVEVQNINPEKQLTKQEIDELSNKFSSIFTLDFRDYSMTTASDDEFNEVLELFKNLK